MNCFIANNDEHRDKLQPTPLNLSRQSNALSVVRESGYRCAEAEVGVIWLVMMRHQKKAVGREVPKCRFGKQQRGVLLKVCVEEKLLQPGS